MNKLMIVTRVLVIIAFTLFAEHSEVLAHTNELSEKTFKSSAIRVPDQLIKSRLENLSSVIEINYTPEVGRRIREYTVDYRIAGEKLLGRADLFFPLFEEEIEKRNLPEELKYIAVVESNLDPMAYSKAGAVGLWQFIKSTGRMKGLKIDNYIDERKDPKKSTVSALDYLTDLYEEFDDWTLAVAAYNCGPGGVRKAIRRGGSTNFWEIRGFLPNETQKYVPRIIAAMYLMQYYHTHNLIPVNISDNLKNVIRINDGLYHKFSELSKNLDVPYRVLRKLNPQFNTTYFPKHQGNLNLVIPTASYEKYLEIYNPVAYKKLIAQRIIAELLAKEYERKIKVMETRVESVQPILSIYYGELQSRSWRRERQQVFNHIDNT